jgi:Rrf2 family protein
MATLQDIPNRYLEQLLATLRRGGLIKSTRGAKGGYVLTRPPGKITVLDALSCIEGLDAPGSVKNTTSSKVESEVIQEIWQEASDAAYSVLQKYTLQDLYERRKARQEKGLMYYI